MNLQSNHGAGRALAALLMLAVGALPSVAQGGKPRANTAPPPPGDPRAAEIPLPAAPGWNAFFIHEVDSIVETIASGRFTDHPGSPQVIVLDRGGHCTMLQSDSGKWLPQVVIDEGASLAACAWGDLDPRVPGTEVYVGGAKGNLHQLRHHGEKGWSAEVVAADPTHHFSKFILGDLDPARHGQTLLAFTHAGPILEILPTAGAASGFTMTQVGAFRARVRDAVLLPPTASRPPRVVAMVQTGEVMLVSLNAGKLAQTVVSAEPVSITRTSRRPPRAGEPEVIYVGRVDGVVLRFVEAEDGSWSREVIYAGPQGIRALVAGRLSDDPSVETLVVSGFSCRVQMLSHMPGAPWRVETIFSDIDYIHWINAGELDGRNTTDELFGGGYSRRIFLLARAPGYGLKSVATDQDDTGPDALRQPSLISFGAQGLMAAPRAPATATAARMSAAPGANDDIFTSAFDADPAGSRPAGWIPAETAGKGTPATWSIAPREGAPAGRQLVQMRDVKNAGSTFNLLLTDRSFPADVRVSVQIRSDSGTEDQGGGVVWRAKDANNYYVARWNPLESNFRIYKVEGGVRTFFKSAEVPRAEPRSWHTIAVVADGTRMTASFDGQALLEFEDSTFVGGGRSGLWSKADAASSFADFQALWHKAVR